jgi:hypothetical protein
MVLELIVDRVEPGKRCATGKCNKEEQANERQEKALSYGFVGGEEEEGLERCPRIVRQRADRIGRAAGRQRRRGSFIDAAAVVVVPLRIGPCVGVRITK